jgi:hypothetical protein
MPSSTTPGTPIIDSSRATMSAWPSPRVDRLGTPKAPAIRFTRAMTFGATWFTHLLRPARLLAPQYGSDHPRGHRGLLLPGFQRVRPVAGYDCSSDWTPLLAGLSPARMTASLAAPTPSSQGTCTLYSSPVSRALRKCFPLHPGSRRSRGVRALRICAHNRTRHERCRRAAHHPFCSHRAAPLWRPSSWRSRQNRRDLQQHRDP